MHVATYVPQDIHAGLHLQMHACMQNSHDAAGKAAVVHVQPLYIPNQPLAVQHMHFAKQCVHLCL